MIKINITHNDTSITLERAYDGNVAKILVDLMLSNSKDAEIEEQEPECPAVVANTPVTPEPVVGYTEYQFNYWLTKNSGQMNRWEVIKYFDTKYNLQGTNSLARLKYARSIGVASPFLLDDLGATKFGMLLHWMSDVGFVKWVPESATLSTYVSLAREAIREGKRFGEARK